MSLYRIRCLCMAMLLSSLPWGTDKVSGQTAPPQRPSLREQLDRTTQRLTDHSYSLRYKFRPQEKLKYEVVHRVSVETTIDDVTQQNRSHSRAIRQWHIVQSDNDRMTIEYAIPSVNMWSESSPHRAVRYNSETDTDVPPPYAAVAAMVGRPLATLQVDTHGNVIERSEEESETDFGTGGMLVPLPSEPIQVGTEWAHPAAVRVRLTDGKYKTMKTRHLYRLEKVASGVAVISVRNQVLTPVPDARVQSQLLQKLTDGEIRFDIDAGRIVSKKWTWDESIVGFSGAASQMKYLAELTEQLLPDEPLAHRRQTEVR